MIDEILVDPRNNPQNRLERKISSYFASAGINLSVLHSRRIDTGVEFFIAFDRESESPEIMHIRSRLKEELGAKLL